MTFFKKKFRNIYLAFNTDHHYSSKLNCIFDILEKGGRPYTIVLFYSCTEQFPSVKTYAEKKKVNESTIQGD